MFAQCKISLSADTVSNTSPVSIKSFLFAGGSNLAINKYQETFVLLLVLQSDVARPVTRQLLNKPLPGKD